MCCFSTVMLQGHLAAALSVMKWYFIFFLQSDPGEVRRRAARKAPRSNNSPTKGLLTTPGDLYQTLCSIEQHHLVRLSERQVPWTGNNPDVV